MTWLRDYGVYLAFFGGVAGLFVWLLWTGEYDIAWSLLEALLGFLA